MECEIRVQGIVDQSWSAWFDGLQITNQHSDETVIAGSVTDQAALHGLLAKTHGLGLPLISVRCIDMRRQEEGNLEPDIDSSGEHDRE